MSLNINTRLPLQISPDDLVSYLLLTNWREENEGDKWQVFFNKSDSIEGELEIVLPFNRSAYDFNTYMEAAVNLLSALKQESLEQTTFRINHYDTDVLNLRNLETNSYESLPLNIAATQITKLRTLVRQSANSEYHNRPYFKNYNSPLADSMDKHYRFAHTQAGSFIFVIESQLIRESTRYQQLVLPLDDEDREPLPQKPPVERRVLERVVRGLVATKEAVKQQALGTLVESYSTGFNGNMCKTIVDLSQSRSRNIEYSVLWSPKVTPSSDLKDFQPVILNETDYDFLHQAAHILEDFEEDQTEDIRGLVRAVSSDDAPLDPNAKRSVVILWSKPDASRPVRIETELDSREYMLAVEAHKNWDPVIITGEPKRVGNKWHLYNPRDFRLAP